MGHEERMEKKIIRANETKELRGQGGRWVI